MNMEVIPKQGILLIKKHKNTSVKVDIAIEESDNDKSLLTGEVIGLTESSKFQIGETVIFGKYSLFSLILQSEKFSFLDEEDVIGKCNYRE